MRNATLLALALASGCASSRINPDGGDIDATAGADARADARPVSDAAPHGTGDGGIGGDGGITGDAAPPGDGGGTSDAVLADAATTPDAGCGIVGGAAPVLTGANDLAAYPAAQLVSVGATLAGTDGVALTWDASNLYVTATSQAFLGNYEPLHVYLETGTALAAPVASLGKEYSGLKPNLPFTATHLIALRQVDDAGTGGYDGVFTPAATWTTRGYDLTPGADAFVSSDHRTLSAKVPWSALGGCPTSMRVAIHVVHAIAGNEWKDLVPAAHTPWLAGGGGYYEIDLTGPAAVSGWTAH
ncbi:MAG: hypothetical protein K8W52_39385 [Deltaproteobacteria bacterium]|nr:hypothetical protein [Deltaproteobacteria bacterium]